MKLFTTLFFLCILVVNALAQLTGITIAHHDQWNGWAAFNVNPRQALIDLHALYPVPGSRTPVRVFEDIRFMDEIRLEGKDLDAKSKETINLAKMACDLGYREVAIAINWQKAGCLDGNVFYYSSTAIADRIAFWVKALKGYPQIVFQFNDIDLCHVLSASPNREQAADPAWIKAHLSEPRWVSDSQTAIMAMVAKQIIAAAWKVNPKQRFVWQVKNVPLGLDDPLVLMGDNAYVPAAMQDVSGLTWPMTDAARDAVLRQRGYSVPPWQAVSYSTEGLTAYLAAHPAQMVTEAGLPDQTPWETFTAWFRSMSSALKGLGRRGYLFRAPWIWTAKGVDKVKLAGLAR